MPLPVACGDCAIHVDTATIPAFRQEALAKGALEIMDLAFAIPGAEERYQAWLAARRTRSKRRAKKGAQE